MTAEEYLRELKSLRGNLHHADEQAAKDQHLNAAYAISEAQTRSIRCFNFWLKGGDAQEVQKLRRSNG